MSKFGALKGLFSKTDEALGALKREKGTGAEFLRELEKTPGVKPQEIKDRKLDKVLPAMGKTTKAEVQKVLQQNPPPKIEEVMSPKGESIGTQDFRKWAIPGGENYREILLKLPTDEASRRWTTPNGAEFTAEDLADPIVRRTAERVGLVESTPEGAYQSQHFNEPNILAHARVSDRVGPNGEKILHIEEIQSDWHQAGRKGGYKTEDFEKQVERAKLDQQRAMSAVHDLEGQISGAKSQVKYFDEKIADPNFSSMPQDYQNSMRHMSEVYTRQWMDTLPKLMEARKTLDELPDIAAMERGAVPDAPFKKNWHELTTKRLLNYAAENGYDRLAITPGKTQIDRYEEALRKNLDSIEYESYVDDSGRKMFELSGFKNGEEVYSQEAVSEKQLKQLLGEDAASKVASGFGESLAAERPMRPEWKRIQSSDLSIGGEGMKGFYDKILPDYLNSIGKPYGAKVGAYDLDGVPLHSFDITPQMREEIKSKGLPLYQQIGVPAVEGAAIGAGAATIGESSPEEAKLDVQNKVQFADNPDAMHLELMQRK